jgi:hypothetical protein
LQKIDVRLASDDFAASSCSAQLLMNIRSFFYCCKVRILMTALVFAVAAFVAPQRAQGLSLALDSIAAWGKFPKFCIDTYRWGDKFFNTFDTTYVQGTGYKFNGKIKATSWLDYYNFNLPDNYYMSMVSDGSTSAGFWLTYMAVSAGYDVNVSKYFGRSSHARRRWNFRFCCQLFSADFYWVTNDVGSEIKRFGKFGHSERMNLSFNGINNDIFGLDAYYFVNNKRYSYAAAFNLSKLQMKSAGSFFFGFSYWNQRYKFDFSQLPEDMRDKLPIEWADKGYIYRVNCRNYSTRIGYGYNWVFHPNWLLGVAESPIVGVKHGDTMNDNNSKNSFSLYNKLQLSLVWNNRPWFAGITANAENGLIYDKNHALISGLINFEMSVGYRFNLW